MSRLVLQDFLARRIQRGERFSAGALAEAGGAGASGGSEPGSFGKLDFVLGLLDDVPGPGARELARSLRHGLRAEQDLAALSAFARVHGDDTGPAILEHEALRRAAEAGEEACARGKSVLVAGRPGTGRATLVRELVRRLRARGFLVIEASASELLAGQSMIGQLEGRVRTVLEIAGRAPLVWIVPGFAELVWAGRHMQSPTGVLDMLLPHLEARSLRTIGVIEAEGLERLLRAQPRLRQVVDVVRLEPLGEDETLALARRWAAPAQARARPLLAEATLREAGELARHYLGTTAAPGNLFTLLRSAEEARGKDAAGPLELDDLLRALARLTGLPLALLDERVTLDLAALRALFARRVLGQAEAVDCLVERVAMLKAGLVDPGRPAGVFLFTGPTGTGKTEIARTLAEFLSGSAERLVRVDMSELAGPGARARLLGGAHELDGAQALVHRLREQPFAVVLLDEFEKADPDVWDVFLQVFDAGRLTDAQGRTADCRHAIFVLTSNAGAERLAGQRLGFGAAPPGTATPGTEAVQAELARLFRPEFLNRIDRIVVFRPLARAVMREVLQKELARIIHEE
jgi:ATP-dependent Clp protease ATP-binding subunit ClpC